MRLATVGTALVAMIVLSGCTAATSDGESGQTRYLTSGKCPNEEAVVADPDLRKGGALEGDVDGDGAADEVFLVEAEDKPDCSRFLVVKTGDEVLSTGLEAEGGGLTLGLPFLKGLAQIDGRPGDEVYVTVLTGASTEFLSVFSTGAGKLERLEVDGSYGPLFPSGASAAHAEATDCRPGEGRIVIEAATRVDPRGWNVTTSYWRFDGKSFVRDGEAGINTDPVGIRRDPTFKRTPFGSCPTSAA
ncbi:MAG: hypothetical protein LC808_25745 [Actinobacteria bacterium]|nr:hypothetical protein [Actinomycetota bacterium]